MKISKRLQTINAKVQGHYHHIWDCCCDHGHLGISLLQRNAGQHIHFVDIVPAITDRLFDNLERSFPKQKAKQKAEQTAKLSSQWHVHCVDVHDLPIDNDPAKKHLVIIAGVGGLQSIAMVQGLLARFPGHQLEFLLCPLRHQFQLRSALQQMNLGLIDECLLKENKWFYEVIHVSAQHTRVLAAVGSVMWHNAGHMGQRYLTQTLAHYQRMVKSAGPEVNVIIAAYQQLQTELASS